MPEDRRKYPCVDCRTMGDEIARLRAEVEALRKDAARWTALKRMRWDDLQMLKQQDDKCDFTERFDALAAGLVLRTEAALAAGRE